MNHANIKRSKRLQKVLGVLMDGKKHSTWDLVEYGRTVAPATCVSELRCNGYSITHTCANGVHYYQLERGVESCAV